MLEVKWPAQHHTAHEWQSKNPNPGKQNLEPNYVIRGELAEVDGHRVYHLLRNLSALVLILSSFYSLLS